MDNIYYIDEEDKKDFLNTCSDIEIQHTDVSACFECPYYSGDVSDPYCMLTKRIVIASFTMMMDCPMSGRTIDMVTKWC